MTSEQSPEEKEMNTVSENQDNTESISSPIEESQQQEKSSDTQSQEQDDDDESLSSPIEDILPPEVLERLPRKEKGYIERSLAIMSMSGNALQSSSITKQLKPEHITKIIENSEKDSQRKFEKNKISENTKKLGMGAILFLVIVVLFYAGFTKDKDLSEKVILSRKTSNGFSHITFNLVF